MPSNELEDRVHNFFAHDNSLQGQHHSQVVEGDWPVLNNNFWVGTQRQAEPLSSISKSYNSQNSDADRRGGGYPLHVTHGPNFARSNLGPEFSKCQSLPEQPNLNDFMNGNHIHQSRQCEGNFLAMDSDSDRLQLVTSRGLTVRDLQGSVADHEAKSSDRSMTSNSPVTFDLFGGQQPMSHHQSNVPQSFQHQQSMQHLQEQLMIKKMQELQWQQQLQQLDSGQQNFNHVSPFTKQSTVSQSTLVNGTLNSGTLQNPWTAGHGMKWLNQGSPSMKGSPSGPGFPSNLGQTQQLVDLAPQQVDQSLYGVPISSSMDLTADQYNQMVTARSPIPHKPISSSFHQNNHHNILTDQVDIQDESSISRQNSQNKNMFGFSSRESANAGMRNLGYLQHMNSTSKNESHQDLLGRRQQAGRPETSHENPNRQVASSQNEVALDPTEKRILFGSDDNIWSAFGNEPHMSGDSGNSLNGGWSALMQSAVAETSSSELAPQEEWSDLVFHNNDAPSGNQPHPVNDSHNQGTYLADDNLRMSSAPSSGSFPMIDAVNSNNAMGLNQLGKRFQNGHGQRPQTEISQKNFQTSKEAGRWSNNSILQKSVAEGGQVYRDASQHTLQADRNAKVHSPSWVSGQTGTALQSNGWNVQTATSPGDDRVINTHEAEHSQHNSQNSQVRVMQGDVVLESSLWKSNSGRSSAIGLGHVNSRIGNSQASQGSLSLKGADIRGETSPFDQSNYSLDQWKNAHSSIGAQESESLGRLPHQANKLNKVLVSMNSREKDEVARHGMRNCDGKENSNDSHRSNLSEHTSGGFREGGLPELGESQSLPTGNQMSTNQLSRKLSVPRKFQYHPMGNVDHDVEPTYIQKHPTLAQAISHHKSHPGHAQRSSTVMEKGLSSNLDRDAKCPDEEPSRGNLSGTAPNLRVPFSRPGDTYSVEKASSSSQNMLELFQKVNQSRNHSEMMQFSPSECNASPQPPEAETFVGVGVLQRSESSVSQGFGLQLGPPSQRLQIPDTAYSSQNGQGTFNPLYSSNDAVEMGHEGRQMVPMHSIQSMPMPSVEETQSEFNHNRCGNPGQGGNDNPLYKTSGNFTSAIPSGSTYSRSNSQNQPITRVSGDSFSGHASHSTRRSVEMLLPDVSESFQQDNLASSGNIPQRSGSNDTQERVPAATMPTKDGEWSSQHFAMPDMSGQGYSAQVLHNMRTTVPTHKRNMGVQFQQVSSHVPESSQPRIVESSSAPFLEGDVNSQGSVDVNKDRVPKMKNSLGKASTKKNCTNGSPTNSASTQNDVEAFGRSLKSSSVAETESSNWASKGMKGPDNVAGAHQSVLKAEQHNEHSNVVGDSLGPSAGVLSADPNMVGYSRPADILQRGTFQQGNIASQTTLGHSQHASQSYSRTDYMTSARVDTQMAPLGFNQYGTFQNGQMLPINDSLKIIPLRPGEPRFTLNSEDKGTLAPTDACQTDESHQNLTSSFVATEHFLSQSPKLNVTSQHPAISRPEKRKTATSDLHAWHKEISEGSQDPGTLSMAEVGWSKATNRLTEKVEDDAELTEGGSPVRKSKRRLILSTQLMQQLLRPAPEAILSADASNSYESVAYTVSRIALGDACNTLSSSSNLDVSSDGTNILLPKGNSAERKGDRHAKVTAELKGKSRKLENDLSRLDKSASILDVRVEFQDLERFAVINRFARFHGRGHTDNVENTSSNVTASTQKPYLQRYVTAVPMPERLPDRVQCLSL